MNPPRSLILITIDCLRADHVGCMGYSRPTTPFLDSLTRESIVFKNAIAAGAPTYYSLPAILASRHPLALGRDLLGLSPKEDTIASVLQESGFATAAFSAANPYISERFGYDRGFDVFHDFLDARDVPPQRQDVAPNEVRHKLNRAIARSCDRFLPLRAAYDELYFQYCQRVARRTDRSFDMMRRFPAADTVVERAIAWIQEKADSRFFLWLHLMDPHGPYYPKESALTSLGDNGLDAAEANYINSYWARSDLGPARLEKVRDRVIRLYDAGIRFADEQIARLAGALVDLNLWDRCALSVTADHGEEFLDHGGRFHLPLTLKEELVRVPWLLRIPGIQGLEIEAPISLIDVAPTLLDSLAVPAPADFRGRSCCAPAIARRPLRPVISEAVRGCLNPFHRRNRLGPRLLAIRRGNFKLNIDFAAGHEELFDLASDPCERTPISEAEAPEVYKELMQYAKKHLAESYKSRDFDRRSAAQLRDVRLEWAQSAITSSVN